MAERVPIMGAASPVLRAIVAKLDGMALPDMWEVEVVAEAAFVQHRADVQEEREFAGMIRQATLMKPKKGKTGATFFLSDDSKLVVKVGIKDPEMAMLEKVLPAYMEHVEHQVTLLDKKPNLSILAAYKVKNHSSCGLYATTTNVIISRFVQGMLPTLDEMEIKGNDDPKKLHVVQVADKEGVIHER